MPASLFVVHGSHPCATVERALHLKGVDHQVVELPPAAHAPVQKLLFGRRTVPGLRLADGERLTGSRAILRRLDELHPTPALLPADAGARRRVLEAEAWGDDVLQPIPRRVLWYALDQVPTAIPTFQEHSKLPLPAAVRPLLTPAIVAVERRMNRATDAGVRADLRDLPRHLDRIESWLRDGTLGGSVENAADLQIAASLRLLMTMEDLAGPLGARPAGALANRVFPAWDGHVPAGAFPEEWLSALRG
ncbi:glutathione S-transferase family protein [Patulibacter minatonensis]|uniref:glutathione S-transferase family protein n=1 Tax=Patulibacter minatonensis TaxID=298163 RepID=UPI0005693629|nr:glutathione S-transferase family protein [Patulibacter minatonensis]